jgi:hypothetical protein
MPTYTQALNLDSAQVETLAVVHYGYARYLAKSETKGLEAYTASSFLIAGVLQSLINTKKAEEAFMRRLPSIGWIKIHSIRLWLYVECMRIYCTLRKKQINLLLHQHQICQPTAKAVY